jgi:hypothetical protein
MKALLKVCLIALVSLVMVQTVLAAPAHTPRSDCLAASGVWDFGSGGDDNNGTCKYPAGSARAVFQCGPNQDYWEGFFLGTTSGDACWPRSPVSTVEDFAELPPLPESQVIEPSENEGDPATVNLGEDKGSITFDPGACVTKCSVRTHLPRGANSSLPTDAVDTMYVRMGTEGADDGGFVPTGTYTVCFKNPTGKPLVVYKFGGSGWIAQTVATADEQICIPSSGNGAFYLGKEIVD